jgi:hypothetical protein
MEANKRFEMVPDPEKHAKPEAIWQRRDFVRHCKKGGLHGSLDFSKKLSQKS